MKRYGLIGYPLSHSFSQRYFTDKFLAQGIDAVYENFPMEKIDGIDAVLQQYPDLCGFNITIPHKKDIISRLSVQSDVVSAMGACNCVRIRNGQLEGFNTDVLGFESSLKPFLKPYHRQALVLGTGGAAAAVQYVLKQLQIPFVQVSRKAGPDSIAYEQLDAALLASHQLIINTTPLGMYPNTAACPAIPYKLLTPEHHLYDLIYNPAETRFLQLGREAGATIQNGEEMLVLQAEESWRIWNE
jgi:shikimate dehydrogenase